MAAGTLPPVGARRAFRTDIEGLRAVAVGLVLLFHAGVPGFAGGYVGVDVFFVLSGYLITGLLLNERRTTGTIGLRGFYARRARRLLPASALVVVTTLVVARLVLPRLLVAPTAVDGLWATAWLANVRFIRSGLDYLAASGPESPLLHFWSLAVEEQFYLLWPLLILVVTRGATATVLRRVGWTVALVGVASLATSVLVTRSDPVIAYYALHPRAWELAVGAGLAVASARGVRLPAAHAARLSWVGLTAVVASALWFTTATPFPGWAALLPVLGTAAVILGGEGRVAGGADRLLRRRPLQAVGRVSYALYLWHWPALVLGEHAAGRALTGLERSGAVAVAAVLAWATLHLVEDPVRRASALRPPARSLALGSGLVVVAAASALVVTATLPALTGRGTAVTADVAGESDLADLLIDSADVEVLPATLEPPLERAASTLPAIYDDGCFVDWDATSSPPCVYGDPEGDRTVVLFGDSHGAQWFPAFELLADQHGWRLVVLTKPSCPAADIVVSRGAAPYPACVTWRDDSVARIAHERPEVVVISNARTYAPLDDDLRPRDDVDIVANLGRGYERLLGRLREAVPSTQIVLLGDTVRPGYDVPTCLADHLEDIDRCWADPARAVSGGVLAEQRAVAEDAGARFVDPTPWLCTDATCPVVVGDRLVYFDEDHLTPAYVRTLAPLLEPALGSDEGDVEVGG